MSSPPSGASEDDLLVLGGNIAALASRAALELDNLLQGQAIDLVAVPWLASEIKDSIASQESQGPQESLTPGQKMKSPEVVKYNLSKVMVINRAFDAAGITPPLAKVSEIVFKAGEVASLLEELAADPDGFKAKRRDEVEKMRSFCLAFAKSTLASRRSRKDSRRLGRQRR